MMVDLETMSNGPSAAIIQIGAVEFDGSGLGREFSTGVCLQSCIDHGLEVDGSTVKWWMEQSDAARSAAFRDMRLLPDALAAFECFVKETGCDFVWAKPADFDLAILRTAFRAIKR